MKVAPAIEGLAQSLNTEEHFDNVVEAYYEFELELLTQSLQDVCFDGGNWTVAIGRMRKLSRRLSQLLSACRMYTDQIPRNLAAIFSENSDAAVEDFRQHCSEQYDSRFGYRLMEQLRNYSQHAGSPINLVRRNHRREDATPNGQLLSFTAPHVCAQTLAQDSKIKPTVLKELLDGPDEIDLRYYVREYVSGIGVVHETIRAKLDHQVTVFEEAVKSVESWSQEQFGSNELWITILEQDEAGATIPSYRVFSEFIERRRFLCNKNRHIKHFAWSYVTNRADDPKQANSK